MLNNNRILEWIEGGGIVHSWGILLNFWVIGKFLSMKEIRVIGNRKKSLILIGKR